MPGAEPIIEEVCGEEKEDASEDDGAEGEDEGETLELACKDCDSAMECTEEGSGNFWAIEDGEFEAREFKLVESSASTEHPI